MTVLPTPLGVIAHIGCCVQKTNGSVSSGPGKELQRYRHKTLTCVFGMQYCMSVTVLVFALTRPAVTTPHSHCVTAVSRKISVLV